MVCENQNTMDYYFFHSVAQRLKDKGWELVPCQHGTRMLCRYLKGDYMYEVSLPWDMLYNRVHKCGKVYGSVTHFCGYDHRPLFEFKSNWSENRKWLEFNQWMLSMFNLTFYDLTPHQQNNENNN